MGRFASAPWLTAVAILALGAPASAQPAFPLEKVAKSEARADFDIAAANFNVVEYPGASERVSSRTPLTVRFQMQEAYTDNRWMPLLGFSLIGESPADELQIDFVEAPGRDALVMMATRIYRISKSSDSLAMAPVPKFEKRDVHEIRIEVAVDTVTVVIDGKRRPLPLDFPAKRMITRASGVKGWVEFVDQQVG